MLYQDAVKDLMSKEKDANNPNFKLKNIHFALG